MLRAVRCATTTWVERFEGHEEVEVHVVGCSWKAPDRKRERTTDCVWDAGLFERVRKMARNLGRGRNHQRVSRYRATRDRHNAMLDSER